MRKIFPVVKMAARQVETVGHVTEILKFRSDERAVSSSPVSEVWDLKTIPTQNRLAANFKRGTCLGWPQSRSRISKAP